MSTPNNSGDRDNLQQLVDAFRNCEWEAIFNDGSHERYSTRSTMLSDAAKKAEDDGLQLRSRVLRLLSLACCIMLVPEKPNEPFQPAFTIGGSRSIIPDDFSDTEIDFFAEIIELVDNPFLKGRLADLVWYRKSPRDVSFALAAIDSYTQLLLEAETWFSDVGVCWRRAIKLSSMIGKTAGGRLVQIEAAMLDTLEATTSEQGLFGCWIADSLLSDKLGKANASDVIKKLESLAKDLAASTDFAMSESYYDAASKWAKYASDENKFAEMTAAKAEALVNEATDRLSSQAPSFAAAAWFIEDAIQTYRSIPRRHRGRLNADTRIEELKLLLNEYGRQAADEMKTIELPPIDVSENVQKAREAVSGKPIAEALYVFTSLHRTNARELRESAVDSLSRSALRGLLPKVTTSSEGRITARTPGLTGVEPSEADKAEIDAEMTRMHYMPIIGLAVHTLILPAREVLISEHRIREAELIELARRSPIVPVGRELLFGRALAHGFNYDFPSCLHLLAPQIEHMVRYHLQSAGVNTTHLDLNGIENEIGLSALMEIPETISILGDNLHYEIRALFCEQTGANLRNDIAHGLLDVERAYSTEAVYAWWFGLKLVFMPFWTSLKMGSTQTEQSESKK